MSENDYGFSFVDEVEVEKIDDYKARLQKVEELMLPFLNNLTVDPKKVMIKWPNRVDVAQAHIKKLLALTRDG